MKVGLITGEYPPMQGGVGDFTRELALALADLGHEAHIITRAGCGVISSRRPPTASRLTVHPVISHWGWRSIGRVVNLARHLQLDALDIQYQAAAYDLHPAINFLPLRTNFLPAKRGGRIPIGVTFHDLKTPYLFPKAGPLRDWVVTQLARRADAAIVTNRADELALIARRVGRVERIPIGSNIAPTLPDDYGRNTYRARLGLTPDDFLLGFFGFLNARKGVETLIHALGILQLESPSASLCASICSKAEDWGPGSRISEFPNFRILFIGGAVGSSDATNRAYADRMTALIAELGLTGRVHYTGYAPAPDVSAAFAATDLCVLPYADGVSFHHGTLMAALVHGCPVVSTLPPVELPELMHGENVWLVPPEDPNALAVAITTLAANPERRERLARGAAELSAEFSWERIAARTADLFENVKLWPEQSQKYDQPNI